MTPGDQASPRARAILQLLRPANVATAIADVVAGYAVTGRPPSLDLAWLLLATACLYAGGVVLNDVFDHRLDAVERPERPIPSGKISPGSAGILGSVLLLAGVGAAFGGGGTSGMVAAVLALSVLAYDGWGKHAPVLGPVNMGLCRGLNLLLGMAAAPSALARLWPLGFLPLVYIAAVTMVSRGEVGGGRPVVSVAAFAMVSGVLAALGALSLTAAPLPGFALAILALLAWRVLPPFWRAVRFPEPPVLRAAVRAGVLSLVLVNGVIAAVYADIIYSLAVLLTGVVAVRLARLFAVT